VIDADMGVLSRLYETAKARKSTGDSHGITPVVIAITKHDLETDWLDNSMRLRAETFAKERGINVFHTSAKNDAGISNAFSSIFELLVKNTTRKPRLMGWKE
jgi:signal recognition particle receptor subunit beta